MRTQFELRFDTMPKGTAQQKRYDGRRGIYFKSKKLIALEQTFANALFPYTPELPSDKPIKLVVWFGFDTKEKRKWGHYKTTRPDCDNYVKEFKDVMTKVGFWLDDAQVVDLHIIKTYSENAFIWVRIDELEEGLFGGAI